MSYIIWYIDCSVSSRAYFSYASKSLYLLMFWLNVSDILCVPSSCALLSPMTSPSKRSTACPSSSALLSSVSSLTFLLLASSRVSTNACSSSALISSPSLSLRVYTESDDQQWHLHSCTW